MSKQRVIDETQILQMHEGNAQALLTLWNDGLIDLDVDIADEPHRIGPVLRDLIRILDRSIRSRNKQIEADDDPRNEYGYDPDRL